MIHSLILLLACANLAAARDCDSVATRGDFENGARGWVYDGHITTDPLQASNHVVELRGPDEGVASASAPLSIPAAVDAVQVRFRVLVRPGLKLNFDSRLYLRVRLYSAGFNSRVPSVAIRPRARWQTFTLRFGAIGEFRHESLFETLNSAGPLYLDDVCVTPAQVRPEPTSAVGATEPTARCDAPRLLASWEP